MNKCPTRATPRHHSCSSALLSHLRVGPSLAPPILSVLRVLIRKNLYAHITRHTTNAPYAVAKNLHGFNYGVGRNICAVVAGNYSTRLVCSNAPCNQIVILMSLIVCVQSLDYSHVIKYFLVTLALLNFRK